MDRRGYLLSAVALVAMAVAAVAYATGTAPTGLGGGSFEGDGRPAPELDVEGWLNSDPLTDDDLEGKVVLYDFWTYSCINCVRTVPSLQAWHERYAGDGLVVVGVHSPEFDFEKDHGNVERAVARLGIGYPVALDDEMATWGAFANRYWPTRYLYDRGGRQVSVHIGEGGHDRTEDEIRDLLGVPSSAPRAEDPGAPERPEAPAGRTPEIYTGSERGGDGFASRQLLADGTTDFTPRDPLSVGEHALEGRWEVTGQYVESAEPGASLRLRYVAGEVNLVMSTATGAPVDVEVSVDGGPPTTVRVDDADLYPLARLDEGDHTLTLTPASPGLRAFAFTFGP